MPVQSVDAVDPARLRYPEHLPVVERRDDILAALREHQVVVVAGETGSGKTTQLPKMCLELGRGAGGRGGQIGHTQPRRIAARSVAERIAEEMQVELGELVGYQVRFTDHSSDATRLKVMTDGILLAEMQRDRDLRRYDTIIIDEAHERSLNIDFILGYLKQLLPRRPDLKVVVTSATIDPVRFAAHFATDERGQVVREVPVIEVSGRTYPVEVRYRPLVELHPDGRHVVAERDQVTGVVEAVEELWTEAPPSPDATDILAFFSGEREIRDAADALNALKLPNTEVLPLFARLSAAEQHRVFHRGSGRRIILATNVAETSLTVPGIGYVVDTGTARISRYSQRTKVQRLPIEPVSRASASQRAGRCGRVAPGVCIRLYSEEDFEARPEFTEPEIQRTSLASVILQMTSLGLGDVSRFPFVDPPDERQVADGVRLLEELGAFATGDVGRGRHRGRGRRLTASGTTLARLPLDPRLGRMVIEAGRLGCTREVLVVVAALSIQDPRERPVDKEAQADQSHARFKDVRSDFATLHTLWRYLKDQQKELSHSAFRRMCKAEYLHYLRIREWQDLHAQLRTACRSVRIDPDVATSARDAEPDWDTIHKALLAGLLSHVGARDEARREYAGARGARFGISPGSALFRKQPDLVMAAELVETSRLWARVNAAIEPEWAEEVGAHVVARTVSEPRWSRKAGAAVATERVTLFGVPLVTDRTIQYARVDPEAAREIFVRSALVEGDWEPQHDFWKRNVATLARVAELEERARRRDIVVDDEVLFAFYDSRIPPDVLTERHFDRWWRGERRRRPDLLTLTEDDLTSEAGEEVSAADYPRTWRQGDLDLDVTYQFSPGAAADGVTVHVPVAVLNRVTSDGFDWQVPGLRDDLAVALLKSLPKATRRHFVPTPDHAMAALALADPASGTLVDELTRALHERTGVRVPPGEWDLSRVPDHLRITFSVDGPGGRVVARGKDLEALRDRLERGGAGRDGARRRLAGALGAHHVERRQRARDVRGTRRRPDGRGLPGPGRRGRVGRAAGAARPGRGAGSPPRRCAPAAPAQHHGPLEAGARPALEHPEAGPGRQPARVGTRPAAGLPRRRRRRHRRRARARRGAHRGGLCRGARRRACPRGHPGAGGRRGGRAGARPCRPGAAHPRGARAGSRLGAHRADPSRRARPARQPRAPRVRRGDRGGAAARRAALPARHAAPPRARRRPTRASRCSSSRWMPSSPRSRTCSSPCPRPAGPRPTSPTSAGWSRSCGSACSPRPRHLRPGVREAGRAPPSPQSRHPADAARR